MVSTLETLRMVIDLRNGWCPGYTLKHEERKAKNEIFLQQSNPQEHHFKGPTCPDDNRETI